MFEIICRVKALPIWFVLYCAYRRAKANLGIHEGKFDGNFSAFAKTTIADAAQDCINQAARFFGAISS